MAKIDTQEINVGTGGSDYVRPFIPAKQSADPQILANLVDTGLKGFKAYKRHEAEGEAKSLLEKFTGYERKAELLKEEDSLDERELKIEKTLSQARVGDDAFVLAKQEQDQILRARGELEKKRDAVDQGLLSLEDYRREAETLYYQQVAMTPGLKDEIAGVMAEYLGIDPRGQSAAIMMEKRKAELKAGRDTLSTMRSSMQKLGLWDEWATEEQNFQKYSNVFKERARALGDIEYRKKQLEASNSLTEAQLKQEARGVNSDMVKAKPQVLQSMGFFGEKNIFKMSTSDIMNMPEETRIQWRNHLKGVRDQYLSVGNSFQALLGDHFDPTPHANDVNARFEQIDAMLSGKLKEEDLATRLAILNTQNSMVIEAEKEQMLLTNQQAARLTAIRELLGTETLAASAAASTTIVELLEGRMQDLNNLDPTVKAEKLKTFNYSLQQISKGWNQRQDWDDNHTLESGRIAAGVARHLPDELDDVTRRHLMSLTSNKDFMDRLKDVEPRTHAILAQNTAQHQAQLQQNMTTMLQSSIADTGRSIRTDNFFLRKESGSWVLSPTEEGLTPRAFRKGTRVSATISQERKDAIMKEREQIMQTAANGINLRSTLDHMIKSRANILQVTEEEAARMIAMEMGLASKDMKPGVREELPGFAEEAGVQ